MDDETGVGDQRSLAEQLAEAHSVDALADAYANYMARVLKKEKQLDGNIMAALYLRLFQLEGLTAEASKSSEKTGSIVTNFYELVTSKMTGTYGLDPSLIEQLLKEKSPPAES